MESMSVVTFWWPSNEDIPAYLEDGVLCETEPPIPINQRGCYKQMKWLCLGSKTKVRILALKGSNRDSHFQTWVTQQLDYFWMV